MWASKGITSASPQRTPEHPINGAYAAMGKNKAAQMSESKIPGSAISTGEVRANPISARTPREKERSSHRQYMVQGLGLALNTKPETLNRTRNPEP